MDTELAAQVRQWIEDDPDPRTKAELASLVHRGRWEELADRFSGTLQFGTAGLRGKIGGGPNRMNRAVVIRAAWGIAAYAKTSLPGADHPPRAVIGYDARHRSADFARDTAAVFTAAGLHAMLLPRPLPTPILAFALRHFEADVGVMVTASHNPPEDNGYKVYLGGRIVQDSGQGAQIAPPFDAAIAARIADAPPASQVPRSAVGWSVLDESIVEDYVMAATALARPKHPADVRIVYTPMHGVGGDIALRVLAACGFTDVHQVRAQAAPDPDFPTVAFPNPEEPGAIDLAIDLAREVHADLVIANDPDADRCAVAVRDPGSPSEFGGWRMLHGDELGALLGDEMARRRGRGSDAVRPVLANSIVSSRLLGKIAERRGANHVVTLTGFKWIARTPGLVYGYEEAIGYCVDPARVRDKDGITAGLLAAAVAAKLKSKSRTLIDALDDLARTHGLHLTDQLSIRVDRLDALADLMASLRANPPATLGGWEVVRTIDLRQGWDSLPPTDGLAFFASDDSRVIVRPSGTEPKVKCYLEVVLPVHPSASQSEVAGVRDVARRHLGRIKSDLEAVFAS